MKCISFTIILKNMKSGLKTGILEVLSDWSAEISPDALQQWTETVGKFGLGGIKDIGLHPAAHPESTRLYPRS